MEAKKLRIVMQSKKNSHKFSKTIPTRQYGQFIRKHRDYEVIEVGPAIHNK